MQTQDRIGAWPVADGCFFRVWAPNAQRVWVKGSFNWSGIELGNEFCFVGRQRRLRIGGEWYRVDLLFFHRKLRCLVIIDLKVGKFSHADAGQMHLYCNYAREHWTQPDENPPVGLILCAEKDDALARYSLEGLPNKILAREYKLALPNEQQLAAEIDKARNRLEARSRTLRLGAGRKA